MWVYTIRLTWPKVKKNNNAHLYLWRTLCAFSNHLPTLEVITVLTYTIQLQKSKEMINNIVYFLFFFTLLYVCEIHIHWTDLLCNLKYVKVINMLRLHTYKKTAKEYKEILGSDRHPDGTSGITSVCTWIYVYLWPICVAIWQKPIL